MKLVMIMLIGLLFLGQANGKDLIFSGNKEKVFKISSWTLQSDSSTPMDEIAKKFEIISRKGNTYEIYVLDSDVSKFKALAPNAILNSLDTDAEIHNNLLINPGLSAGYRDFESVNQTLQGLAQKFPNIVKLEVIGQSTNGLTQYGLKISDNVNVDEDEPELIMTSATHGDEIITTEVLLRFIESLISGYQQNPRLTAMIDTHELFFVPVVNPDGFIAQRRYSGNIDPNRDYPWPGHEEKVSVQCIANMINFFKARKFSGSIDFHAFGELIMYPWAFTKEAPIRSDEIIFDKLGQEMSAANSYTYGQISKVIYVAEGSSADYYYWKFNTLAFGIEIANSKAPPVSQIPKILNQVTEMTYKFIEHF